MSPEEKEILISKYLNNELTAKETEALSDLRKTDRELDKHLKLHEETHQTVGDNDLNDSERDNNLSKPEATKDSDNTNKKNTLLVIAASIAFLVVVSALTIWISDISADTSEIYTAYYKPFPDITTYRGDSTTTSSFEAGMQSYSSGEYESAIRQLTETSENTLLAKFYTGISYMSLEKFDQAVQYLAEAGNITDSTDPLYEEILWYQALCHMQLRNNDKMVTLLKKIIEAKGKRTFQADAILDLTENK
ncbi:MAG: hypothetical protein WBA74_25810 [Cyclobacteriaceae bacterium]